MNTYPRGHYSLFYTRLAQALDILAPFFADGLREGAACFWFVPPPMVETVRGWLQERHVDVAESVRSGQLSLSAWGDPSPPQADRTMDEFLRNLERRCETAVARYPTIREASIGFDQTSGYSPLQVAELESRANPIIASYPLTAICCYELYHLSGSTLQHLLQTHPETIGLDGIRKNPYVKPATFLKRLGHET